MPRSGFEREWTHAGLMNGVEHIIFEAAILHRNAKPGRIHRDSPLCQRGTHFSRQARLPPGRRRRALPQAPWF